MMRKQRDMVCPMCKRMKSAHTQKELLACASKEREFKKKKVGGELEHVAIRIANILHNLCLF